MNHATTGAIVVSMNERIAGKPVLPAQAAACIDYEAAKSTPLATHSSVKPEARHLQDLYRGCLLGGAVGDALGAPVEFMTAADIRRRFGSGGIQEYIPAYGKLGAITDDTQMTLFTAEGLLRAWSRQRTFPAPEQVRIDIAWAYLRWLHTQGQTHMLQEGGLDGWLLDHNALFSRRAPGNTCMSGLTAMCHPTDLAGNESKGCGGVMRVAPVGMIYATLSRALDADHARLLKNAFDLGCQAAAITHGHPTGQLASGAFAAIIMELLTGHRLRQAVDYVLPLLAEQLSHGETTKAIRAACSLAKDHPNNPRAMAQLGGGWVGEEALAIALYCALSARDFRSGVTLSVNHSGDSDSTGSMTGQLLGAVHGLQGIPITWLEPLELREVIEAVADDLAVAPEVNA